MSQKSISKSEFTCDRCGGSMETTHYLPPGWYFLEVMPVKPTSGYVLSIKKHFCSEICLRAAVGGPVLEQTGKGPYR